MKWASAYSNCTIHYDCVDALIYQLKRKLNAAPDLIIAFVSRRFLSAIDDVLDPVRNEFPDCMITGCGAEVMMYDGREKSNSTGISLLAASGLQPNCAEVVHLDLEELPGPDESPAAWRQYVGLDKKMNQNLIVFADPFTFGVELLLQGLDYAYNCSVSGGFASGAYLKGQTMLFADGEVKNSGVVILDLGANLEVISILAQGCTPVGDDLEVTRCDDVVLQEVNGMVPLGYLRELSTQLDERKRDLLQRSLFIGVEMDIMKADLKRGDYLIRNIRGINPESGCLVIGDHLQRGQSVRFHIRDPESSQQELAEITEKLAIKLAKRSCLGMIVFSCLGRVGNFYGEDSVDAKMIHRIDKKAPMAGLFCSGEIGQVSGNTYIHGYTATAVLIYEKDK